MAKQTEFDHPPFGHVAILGYDSADDHWHAIYVDDSGRLQIDIAVAEPLDVHEHQYDGAAWRKSNLLWGYNDTVSESVSNTSLAAGTNTLSGTAVAAGEVWVIQAISLWYQGTAPTSLQARVSVNSIQVTVYTVTSITSAITYAISGAWTLKAGDQVLMVITGATLNDDAILRYSGYKMKVTM